MGSPGYRTNIEDCGFKEVGIGLLYPGGTQWIAVVGFRGPLVITRADWKHHRPTPTPRRDRPAREGH